MKTTKLSLATLIALATATHLVAADSLEGMFKEAKVDGKVRFNYFNWRWNDMDDYNKGTSAAAGAETNKDSAIAAIGGSIGFKTGAYNGVSLNAEFFTSNPIAALSDNPIYAKSGADLDLRDAFNTGAATKYTYSATPGTPVQNPSNALEAINVLAIANLQYKRNDTTVQMGRLYSNTPLTSANDTKMVPNTFQGATLESKDLKDTTFKVEYLTAMKPRNADTFGGLLDNDSDVNKFLRTSGITTSASEAAPIQARDPGYLAIAGVVNKSIKGLELQGWYYKLDGILSDMIAEANYQYKINNCATVSFGGRYLRQIDELDGAIAKVAAFEGKTGSHTGGVGSPTTGVGYKNPNSLNSSLWAVRAVLEYGPAKFQAAHSQVADAADIVAPWRGFPTGGYTRPMKIENWDANIKSTMYSFWFDFEKAKIANGVSLNINWLYDNRDESKYQPKGDMITLHADLNYKVNKQWDMRLRFADHRDKGNYQYALDNLPKGWDFTEYRIETVYKF